ncbi:MAG: hypothetical protein PVI30_02915 [Myxococcales bacterium]
MLLAVLFTVVVGCGGASLSGDIYDDGTVRYRVGPRGGGFERVEVEDNDLAFFHPDLGTISVNSTCRDYEDVPETALMNHLLFGTREQDFRLEETVTLDGRGARHVLVDLELDGVPLTLEVFLLRKDGCVYDISHVAARNAPPAAREAFHRLVSGFAVLSTDLDP